MAYRKSLAGGLFCIVVATFIPHPIISKLVDLAAPNDPGQEPDKKNQAGAYFGSYLFMLNIANVVGDIVYGFILTGGNADKGRVGLARPTSDLDTVAAGFGNAHRPAAKHRGTAGHGSLVPRAISLSRIPILRA